MTPLRPTNGVGWRSIFLATALVLAGGTTTTMVTAQSASADSFLVTAYRFANYSTSPTWNIGWYTCEALPGPGTCALYVYEWWMSGSSDMDIYCQAPGPCGFNGNYYAVLPRHHATFTVAKSKAAFDPASARGAAAIYEFDGTYQFPSPPEPRSPTVADDCFGNSISFNWCKQWITHFGEWLPTMRNPGTIQLGINYSDDRNIHYAGGTLWATWAPLCNHYYNGFC